jgi:hypothetical protein
MELLTQEQQDRLTIRELRYYQTNYGHPRFERRMQRLIDSMGADTASRFGEELIRIIIRNYGAEELTDKYTQKLSELA